MKSKNPGAPHSATSRRERRQREAIERQAVHARSTKEQLALIAKRRGESKKERRRLARKVGR